MLFVFVSFVESRPTLVLQWLAPYFSCCVHQQKKSENEADQKKLENIFFENREAFDVNLTIQVSRSKHFHSSLPYTVRWSNIEMFQNFTHTAEGSFP